MRYLKNKNFLPLVITIVLFIIPFFWLKPGQMDLGGDSNRLFFYDPVSNLKAFAIYSVAPWGTGIVAYNQYFIPFLLFLIALKTVFTSPTILIAIFNGFKLSGSFIFTYLIVKELFQNEEGKKFFFAKSIGAILAALLYTFSPSVIDNMRYALVTHNQVFLNPLIFYLFIKYLKTSALSYLWFALLATLMFSTNFSLEAPPPFFAFYPLAITFLLIYNRFVLKKAFPWKGAFFFGVFFVGLHALHLIPVLSNVFDRGSQFNARVFESSSKVNVGLDYFNAILPNGMVSKQLLLPLESSNFNFGLILIPLMVILGFLFVKKKSTTLLLVCIFFFITLFLESANITHLGVSFYRVLFYIPGFGMFRNFYGQWQWVYTFFYALLAGLTISYFLLSLSKKLVCFVFVVTVVALLLRSWVVVNGKIVNVINRGSTNTTDVIKIDPNYERMLQYIKNLPNDGKILHVPFTDFGYNIVGGTNNGVYIGESFVSLLEGKNDFAGYQDIDPYSESFRTFVKDNNFPMIRETLSMLQVRYILFNSDPKVTDKYFPTFPYGYTGISASLSGMLNFVKNVSEKLVYKTGNYALYEVNMDNYLPHFYAAKEIIPYNANPKFDTQYFRSMSFLANGNNRLNSAKRVAYVDSKAYKINNVKNADGLQISFQKINPTKYRVKIDNVSAPFLLVFQTAYSPYWKLFNGKYAFGYTNRIADKYFGGKIIEYMPSNSIIDSNPFETNSLTNVFNNSHIKVNGYANGWYIDGKAKSYEFLVEETSQKMFYYSLIISIATFVAFLLVGLKLMISKYA